MKTASSYPSLVTLALAGALAAATAPRLRADALREETFAIAPGLNLIHVGVEPLVKDPRQALGGLDWESLWTWVLEAPPGTGGRWLGIHRNDPRFLDTLRAFGGPLSYALRARSAGTLRIKGQVRPQRQPLRGDLLQLYGPSVSAATPPTLASYFSRPGVKEHVSAVYEIAAGAHRRLADGDLLRAGAAYWVLADQDLPEPEPVRVRSGLGGLRFDSQTTFQQIEIDVGAGTQPRQVEVRLTPSADGVSTADWLTIESTAGGGGAAARGQGAGGGAAIDLPANQTTLSLTLKAERPGVAGPDVGAVVEVSLATGQAVLGAELEAPTLQGLWMGEASLSEVERMSAYGGGFAPAPALPISMLLEIPEVGRSRLLPCLQVETERDGRKITFRLAAALFHEPVELFGNLAAGGASGTLSATLSLPADHPLNPYRHRYHPEHTTGYDLTRSLKLRFGAAGPAPVPEDPVASVGVLEGVWEEQIDGLAQEPVRVRGSFRLRRLATTTVTPCE
jgi:hypothetical protein